MAAAILQEAVRDERAFEHLYRDHSLNVYRYALAVLSDPADAEDVTQTTFLNAYQAFRRGERPHEPEHWLIAIAHNVCRQRFRDQKRRPHEVTFDEHLGPAALRDDEAPTADELQRAFLQLPPTQRSALVMRELEGRPYAEIAEVLDISVSALETLLFRARRTLREQLEEQLSCREAVFAISRQREGQISRGGRRDLRAHLRRCPECARLAHSKRAQRKGLGLLLPFPLPRWLSSLFGKGGEVSIGASSAGGMGAAGIVLKAAALIVAGAVVSGGVYAGATHEAPFFAHQRGSAPSKDPSGPSDQKSDAVPQSRSSDVAQGLIPGRGAESALSDAQPSTDTAPNGAAPNAGSTDPSVASDLATRDGRSIAAAHDEGADPTAPSSNIPNGKALGQAQRAQAAQRQQEKKSEQQEKKLQQQRERQQRQEQKQQQQQEKKQQQNEHSPPAAPPAQNQGPPEHPAQTEHGSPAAEPGSTPASASQPEPPGQATLHPEHPAPPTPPGQGNGQNLPSGNGSGSGSGSGNGNGNGSGSGSGSGSGQTHP